MKKYDPKIQIPIILFNEIKIHPISFTIYSYLKLKESLNLNDQVIIYGCELKEICNINKNELLKKYLIELKDNKLINFDNSTFTNTTKFEIKIKKLNCGYTLISSKLFSYLKDIGAPGFKLLYYYKFKEFKNKYAYPSFINIENDLGYSPNTITKYNKILIKSKLLKIKSSTFENDEYGDQNVKNNNCYYVMLK